MIDTPNTPDKPRTARTSGPQGQVDALTEALWTERRLIEELIAVMRRQRHAVDDDDLQVVDDSVFATHRVLVTLSEARRRRRTLNALIGHDEDLGIQHLDAMLGARMTPALRAARDELQHAARTLSREVALNRRILREALAEGDAIADSPLASPDAPEAPHDEPSASATATPRLLAGD